MSDPKLLPPDDSTSSDALTVFDDGKATRREFVGTAVVGGALLSTGLLTVPDTAEAASPKPANLDGPAVPAVNIKLNVNGKEHTLQVEPRVTLLDALRERLELTGSKKGCDMGQCGACTVLVDDRRVNACLMLAVMQQGKRITTIEGLAQGDTLHPMQESFIEHDAFQCGYCTPGQIMSAVGFSQENWGQTDADIREGMCGNICRCGAYPHIVAAVRDGRGKKA
ncbi:(2Fe-2S)-binding protein [Hyalangium minutum]|uniref:Periplasmic aromatic aldehyde oxidoreductase, iron-sulfur subunit YagT n=1 Tax=Hyalangium minutum TaxID=394096 RepID=A0A085WWH9_9BACT|nr:(2Fe-2S)-binding protein [Hyalangium minutum]KFE72042.1 Periplasmic aromatic aldehyde oxidoreductase, iron-sulfur subunit YagT [Hyalangium minutum]